MFEVDTDRVMPGVLDLHFRTASVWPHLPASSTGTNARRQRLHPSDLLAYHFPLPYPATQQTFQRVQAQAAALRAVQAEAAAELEALRPAVLGRAFAGDL